MQPKNAFMPTELTVDDMVTEVSPVPSNADTPILVMFVISMEVSDLHPLKTLGPICLTPDRLTVLSEVHPSKIESEPKTSEFMATVVSAEDGENAFSPMYVHLLPIVIVSISVFLVPSLKASFPISTTDGRLRPLFLNLAPKKALSPILEQLFRDNSIPSDLEWDPAKLKDNLLISIQESGRTTLANLVEPLNIPSGVFVIVPLMITFVICFGPPSTSFGNVMSEKAYVPISSTPVRLIFSKIVYLKALLPILFTLTLISLILTDFLLL